MKSVRNKVCKALVLQIHQNIAECAWHGLAVIPRDHIWNNIMWPVLQQFEKKY